MKVYRAQTSNGMTVMDRALTYAPLPRILVDGHKFSSPATLEKYIETLEHGDEQFSAEQQALEFYVTYTGSISEQGSLFAEKVKQRGSCRTAGCIGRKGRVLPSLQES